MEPLPESTHNLASRGLTAVAPFIAQRYNQTTGEIPTMKRILLIVLMLSAAFATALADEHSDAIIQRASNTLGTLREVPMSAYVDTSPYSRQLAIFDKVMFTWDEDAPYLFINGVQLTMAETNFQVEAYEIQPDGSVVPMAYSYTMEMMVVDPEIEQSDILMMDSWIHRGEGGLYTTPAFRYISREDLRLAGDLENSKNIAQGFSGGIGMGLGGIGLSCLITALIVDDYRGTILTAGVVSFGLGGLGVYICNRINDNLNRQLGEVFERMAAAVDGQS
jgi:hypothetical protein